MGGHSLHCKSHEEHSTDVDQGRLCRIPVQKGGLESLREKGSLAS